MPDPKQSDQKKSGFSENSLGAIAYITVVPAIFFLAIPPYNKSANVRYHAWQSIILFALAFILCIVLSFFPALNTPLRSFVYLGLYTLVCFLWILVSVWCAITTLFGKRVKIPLLSAWAEQQSNK
jgi:uncharacterized membrane protein